MKLNLITIFFFLHYIMFTNAYYSTHEITAMNEKELREKVLKKFEMRQQKLEKGIDKNLNKIQKHEMGDDVMDEETYHAVKTQTENYQKKLSEIKNRSEEE